MCDFCINFENVDDFQKNVNRSWTSYRSSKKFSSIFYRVLQTQFENVALFFLIEFSGFKVTTIYVSNFLFPLYESELINRFCLVSGVVWKISGFSFLILLPSFMYCCCYCLCVKTRDINSSKLLYWLLYPQGEMIFSTIRIRNFHFWNENKRTWLSH